MGNGSVPPMGLFLGSYASCILLCFVGLGLPSVSTQSKNFDTEISPNSDVLIFICLFVCTYLFLSSLVVVVVV